MNIGLAHPANIACFLAFATLFLNFKIYIISAHFCPSDTEEKGRFLHLPCCSNEFSGNILAVAGDDFLVPEEGILSASGH